MHRKGFAKTYSTNVVEGAGHSQNPRLFVDSSWNANLRQAASAYKHIGPQLLSAKPFLHLSNVINLYERI